MQFTYYVTNISIKSLKTIWINSIIVFHHYDDNKFKKIIDEFILSSSNDKSLSRAIRKIDEEAAKLEISFYQMIFILIQKDLIKTRKND
ncbi:MAG TPA: hypothetical protein VF047_01995 [Nitrososphaeraceae archaeon]